MAVSGTPWQLECKKVEQRCGYLLTSGLWSDCIFMVGSETNQEMIQAHKLVLAMASPVFEAMLYGGLSERNDPIVPILDIQPEAFRALLQYIYTGNINIDSFDMAGDLWYGAKKYMLPHLITECNSYISSVLSPKNACRAYEFAHLFDEKTLKDKCIKIISTNTKEVLNDSSFVDVQLNTLITVCSLDHLTVDSELDLFHAVARFAKAGQRRLGQISPTVDGEPPSKKLCNRLELPTSQQKVLHSVESSCKASPAAELDSKTPTEEGECTPEPTDDKENMKEVPEEPTIRAALQKIRFLTLTAQEFGEGPACSDLLTQDESFKVFMNITSTASPVPMPTGFSECRERRQPRSDSEQCFDAGSLEHTIIALKCGVSSQVKKAARAAGKLLRTPGYIQQALDKGLLDALVPALTERNDRCKEHAARAIYYFCYYGSFSQLSALAASDALQLYCRLLAAGGDICYWVLRGFTMLLKKVEQNTRVGLISKLREIGAIQLLMAVQEDDYRFYEGYQTKSELAEHLLRTYFRGGQ